MGDVLSATNLQRIMPRLPLAEAQRYVTPLLEAAWAASINTQVRLAEFLAQIGHESADLTRWEENLNYSSKRLREVWPSRFSLDTAALFAHRPQAIANRVYGGRMGNRGEASGDGWLFRGRGPIMCTGHDNYAKYSKVVRADLVARPDLVLRPDIGFTIAAAFWSARNLNTAADRQDHAIVRRGVNGGLNGLDDCIARFARALPLLGAT